ncbi:Melanoma-associated antigen D1 [Labeo rohita]|uniref:Melanoma-associated antigen D1 n=1 Tax=Labeo rohita TaxID=84645 RepID=A0ABQ8MY73_LABRO|nr:Melanoma-associated antigen D1 [Labeo rohita]
MRTQQRKGSHHLPASNVYSPLYQRMLQLEALSSLHQRGTDLREFALEFRSAAEGLGYNDSALKDLFNYALDEPISHWRMLGSEHLSFEGFVEYLVRSGRQSALQREGLSHGEPFHAMATSPELLHRMAASPKPLCTMAATPDSPVITSPTPKASAITDTVSVFPGTMSVSYEAIKVGPRLWRLTSSLADPPLSPLVQEDPTPVPAHAHCVHEAAVSAHDPPDAAEPAHNPPDAAVSAHDSPDAAEPAHNPPEVAVSAHDPSDAAGSSAHCVHEAAVSTPDPPDAAVSAHDSPDAAEPTHNPPEVAVSAHDPSDAAGSSAHCVHEAAEPGHCVHEAAVSAPDPPDAAVSAHDSPDAAEPAHNPPEVAVSAHDPSDAAGSSAHCVHEAAVSAPDPPDAAVSAPDPPDAAVPAPAPELCTCSVTARVVVTITIVPFDSKPPWCVPPFPPFPPWSLARVLGPSDPPWLNPSYLPCPLAPPWSLIRPQSPGPPPLHGPGPPSLPSVPPPLHLPPGLLFCAADRGASGIRSLERGFCHSRRLVCPGWPPEDTVCVSTWLVLCLFCAMCFSCLLFDPTHLLPHYCFSDSTCVSLITSPT